MALPVLQRLAEIRTIIICTNLVIREEKLKKIKLTLSGDGLGEWVGVKV